MIDNESNSSLAQLSEAIEKLSGISDFFDTSTNYDVGGNLPYSYLNEVCQCVSYVRDAFKKVNPQIALAWTNVYETVASVNDRYNSLIKSLCDQLQHFIRESMANEERIRKSANMANEASQEILNRLGL